MRTHWLITDTHFGHNALIKYCGRPPDFTQRIITAWRRDIAPTDIIIHLGDVGMHKWGGISALELPGYKILIKGNHDKQSYTWYLNNGFNFVCESLTMLVYGKQILFSHKPQPPANWDLNIHGHFHNTDYHKHEPNLAALLTPHHLLMALETDGYTPMQLRTFLHKHHQI